jgi:hypothetical protein
VSPLIKEEIEALVKVDNIEAHVILRAQSVEIFLYSSEPFHGRRYTSVLDKILYLLPLSDGDPTPTIFVTETEEGIEVYRSVQSLLQSLEDQSTVWDEASLQQIQDWPSLIQGVGDLATLPTNLSASRKASDVVSEFRKERDRDLASVDSVSLSMISVPSDLFAAGGANSFASGLPLRFL